MSWHDEPAEDRDLIERGFRIEVQFFAVAVALTLLAFALGLSWV